MRQALFLQGSTWLGVLGIVGSVALGSACSSGGDDDPGDASGGGAGESGGSGGKGNTGGASSGGKGSGGSSSNSGGRSSGGAASGGGQPGGGGEGGEASQFVEPDCPTTVEITAGSNYGDYSVFAVRLELDAPIGEYTIRVRSGDDGVAAVFRGDTLVDQVSYDPQASLADNEQRTISFPDLFEIDLRSTMQDDLSALDDSIFDGCHTILVEEAPLVVEGAQYGAYRLVDLVVDDEAEPGIYTFYSESGNSGQVELRRDGELVDTLDYAWMTTVGGGASFRFEFPGTLAFTIERSMGTSNLFGLADLLFDGRQELVVE